jgi:hypothetical protein
MTLILLFVFIRSFKKLFKKKITKDYISLCIVNLFAIGLLYIITFKIDISNPLDMLQPIIKPLNSMINNIINYGGKT